MKLFWIGFMVLNISSYSLGCGGCSKKTSSQISGNIQSTLGTPAANGGGTKIIAAQKTQAAFKDARVFDSVGRDQGVADGEKFNGWSSSISQ